MTEQDVFDARVDRGAFDLILKGFRYMRDVTDVVDWSMPTVSSPEKLAALTAKLESYANTKENPIVLKLTDSDWYNYTNFIHYASTVLPDLQEAENLLAIYRQCDRWEENKFKPDDFKVHMPQWIKVRFDEATLALVLKGFRYMRDTPGAVDWSIPTVSSPEKLKAWIEKLEAFADAGDYPAIIKMHYGEWGGYTNFVHRAHRVAPNAEEGALLEELYDRYDEWDENDFEPPDLLIGIS